MSAKISLRAWLDERRQSAKTIACGAGVRDPAAWLEDAAYFQKAVAAVDKRDELRALLLQWESGDYDGDDYLRRVRLALHGPLKKTDK